MKSRESLRTRFFRDGRLADCPVYDLHGHMGPLAGGNLPRHTAQAMVAAMQRAGVRLVVFCHHAALWGPDPGNRLNIDAVRRFPNHFRAYCAVNGNYPDVIARDVATFDEFGDVYVGFKLLADYHRVAISDPRCRPAWELADARGLLVLLHTWGGSAYDGPEEVRKVASAYPGARILMGHSCHGQWQEAVDLVKEFDNLYFELTAVLDDRGALELFVRETGSERIVFGTDTPWFNHHYYIGAVLGAEVEDEDRRNILYRNAKRLLAPFFAES